jgi:hypothetical protein
LAQLRGHWAAKALAVLDALLWRFHNAKDGRCFPSYARIAEAIGCSPSNVCDVIKRLEAAGLLTWAHRLKRVRERCDDLLGSNGRMARPQDEQRLRIQCDGF